METSRRGFLRGLGGLAAASAMHKGFGLTLARSEEQRLGDMVAGGGVIRGETFLFGDGLILDWQDSRCAIEDCKLYFRQVTRPDMLKLENLTGLNVSRCLLQSLTKNKARSYLHFDRSCHANNFHACRFEGLNVEYGIYCESQPPSLAGVSIISESWQGRIG